MRIIGLAVAVLLAFGCEDEEEVASVESRCEEARNTSAPECDGLDDCPRLDCVCDNDTLVTSRSCAGGMCVPQAQLCADACADKEGWACAAGGGDDASVQPVSQPE